MDRLVSYHQYTINVVTNVGFIGFAAKNSAYGMAYRTLIQ